MAVRELRKDSLWQSHLVPYSRPPAWRYFPQSDAPPPPLAEAAEAFTKMGAWFKTSFWPPIDAGGENIKTPEITQHLETYLQPDARQLHVGHGLLAGWNVETRED